ncbi:MAG: WXG100 family type VII secretion target [Bifidobacteriaceae bacterium]|nr:WXG100 family type VII secretion target [Bifidobacteriaceae bacterium]
MSVRTGQVTALSESLRSRASRILTILENLETQINTLQGSWDGQAREAYQRAQAQWTQEAHRLQQLADQIASTTASISSGYSTFDARAASQFQ